MDKVTHTEQSLDWLKVAKAAGKHGVRYRTNAALVAFLNEVATPAPDSEKLREALVMIAEVQRERFRRSADFGEWCQRTARAALGASA